jgi:hypothetical protein
MRCGSAVGEGRTVGVSVMEISVGRMMVTIGGGNVTVGDAGAGEQAIIQKPDSKIKNNNLVDIMKLYRKPYYPCFK